MDWILPCLICGKDVYGGEGDIEIRTNPLLILPDKAQHRNCPEEDKEQSNN